MRFLNRCFPSNTDASVKPVSISLAACSGVSAILHIHSSSKLYIEASRSMYIKVFSMYLCPSCCLTIRISLVL